MKKIILGITAAIVFVAGAIGYTKATTSSNTCCGCEGECVVCSACCSK